MTRGFFSWHPLVSFLYFALVIGFSMVLNHPACLMISIVGALACLAVCRDAPGPSVPLGYALAAALLAAAVNPMFSHAGATVLAYLPSGNPLTLESIAYGLGAGGMLLAVMLWFACCTRVMTSDRFVYLFGRAAPALALVLSMTLRFLPRFARQMRETADSRRGLGVDEGEGFLSRLRRGTAVLSAVITWSLESAAGTAASMRARGYGLPGRTAFSIYRMERRDRLALLWLAACGGVLLWGAASGTLAWRWYPTLRGAQTGPAFVGVLAAYTALCLTPAIVNGREERRWKNFGSTI